MWGMDMVGPIRPPSSKGYQFILTITDYFSKWSEAIPLKEVKTSAVIKFIKHHVNYHFGVPQQIIHDNEPQFVAKYSRDSATSSEFKVCLQRHTIQPLTVLQKHLTKPLGSVSRSSSQKVIATGMTN